MLPTMKKNKLTDDVSKLYKSVDDDAKHDQKRKIPKKIIYMIAFIIFLVLVAVPLGVIGVKVVGNFIFGAKERGEAQIKEANENLGIQTEETTEERSVVSGFRDPKEQGRVYVDTELHKKYLSEYTVEVANDPAVLPAMVVALGNKCKAYNQYGDLLNVPNAQCLTMLSEKGKIPQRRDGTTQRTQASFDNEVLTDDAKTFKPVEIPFPSQQ